MREVTGAGEGRAHQSEAWDRHLPSDCFLLFEGVASNLVHEAVPPAGVGSGPAANAADFFHGSLRAKILWSDQKDDAIYEMECVLQHEALHLAVILAAPVRPGQEAPADFDLTFGRVVAMEPRGADHSAVLAINGNQGSAGVEAIAKELREDFSLITIMGGMLLPDKRIGGHGIEIVEIFLPHRPEIEEFSF